MTDLTGERAVIAAVVASAWGDDEVRARLLDDPVAVLTAAGLDVPAGCRVTVLEDTDSVSHRAVPPAHRLTADDKQRLLTEIAALLPLPAGRELHLHQETERHRILVLPLPPADLGLLTDDALGGVSGGTVGAGGNGGLGGALGGGPGAGSPGTSAVGGLGAGIGGNGGNGGLPY